MQHPQALPALTMAVATPALPAAAQTPVEACMQYITQSTAAHAYIIWRRIKAGYKDLLCVLPYAKRLETALDLYRVVDNPPLQDEPTPRTPRDAPMLYTSSECKVLVVVPAPCNEASARCAATCTAKMSTTWAGPCAVHDKPHTRHTLQALIMAASGSNLPETTSSRSALDRCVGLLPTRQRNSKTRTCCFAHH